MFKLAEKMVRLSPRLSKLIKIVPTQKMLIGLPMHVEYDLRPKFPPALCRVRSTKGRTNEAEIHRRTDHSDD